MELSERVLIQTLLALTLTAGHRGLTTHGRRICLPLRTHPSGTAQNDIGWVRIKAISCHLL